jgi:predicted solute-binding protein
MTLAVWNAAVADAAVSGLASAADRDRWDLRHLRPEACAAAVLKEQVDVALVPTTMALQGAEGFDVIPGVAVSSWKYPFARILLREGLRGPGAPTLACDRRAVLEQFAARVALREHYSIDPELAPYDAPTPGQLLDGDESAALLTSTDLHALPDTGRREDGGLVMDLGQEWFELTGYPMVWGLFVAREDTLDPERTAALRDRLQASVEHRPAWVEQAQHPALEAFFREDLRLRYDDLVVASLTELKHYLFYESVLDDVPAFTFAPLPEEEGKEGRREKAWGE